MPKERTSEVYNLHPTLSAARRTAIDIIVPVYKSVELTTRCLNSLSMHLHEIASRDPRLILINDSPGERDVEEMLHSFGRRHSYVTVLENKRNLGFVDSVNIGLSIAAKAGRDVLLVNADTETFPGTLKNLLAVADADPHIGFVSPRSNNASFCSLPHVYGGVVATQTESYQRWQLLSRTMPPFHFAPTAVGFYLFIRHAVIGNFGFLDPEFGIGYEEENDLILRASKVGYRAALANNAFAYHAGSASFNLLDMNLRAHQGSNLEKMAKRHSEYLPLVRRYEGSAHFRAEKLLSHLLPSASGQLKVVFDLSAVGPHFNGTNEMSIAIIDLFYERHASKFDVNVICTEKAFEFHKLNRHAALNRHETDLQNCDKFAIGIQLGQPFSVHAISVLEDLAPINIFGMLDTIAEDCGYLSITHQLETLWGHVARHASGLFFNSKYSERVFLTRYPDAKHVSRYARLLPTRLSCYKKAPHVAAAEHILIMGNHFAHKASDTTADILKAAFPTVQFVVMGTRNQVSGNLRAYRSGSLDDKQMESLYTRASIVVLPSHAEGFGFGFVHALAAGKIVVARDIPATREILATYARVTGVFLYADDSDVVRALRLAMKESRSVVEDDGAETWHDWVDGLADFCSTLLAQDNIFARLESRIRSADLVRKAEMFDRLKTAASVAAGPVVEKAIEAGINSDTSGIKDDLGRTWVPARHVKELLALDGEEFVYRVYVTIFKRVPDSEGFVNYLTELNSGIDKLEIISRLKNSSEGRTMNLPLAGYRSIVFRKSLSSRLKFGGTSAVPTTIKGP